MPHTLRQSMLCATLLATVVVAMHAQDQRGDPPDLSDSALINSIPLRSIGPAVMSGRVADIAVAESPGSRGGALGTVVYIAAATGGVWKSTNGGTSWRPIFDDAGVGSIGDVTVAPTNSEIVWVGTGEPNNMRSSSYGDGVYKSTDGGETFQHMGLRTSQHVGRIVIHPENPDIVYVAAVGPLWGPGGERGVFKSTDGGETWINTLSIDQNTGVTDIVMDPSNPNVLLASSLQRERRAYSYVGGGPRSGIYKSTDGGDSWTEITAGLPSPVGRVGLDYAQSQPHTVYAVVEGHTRDEGGVYRSDDGGSSWRQMSTTSSIPWYFGQIRVDPQNPDVVYHLGQRLQRSMDGGRTFEVVARVVHADQHSLWINPENPDHLILGNDGGLYVSRDFAATWDYSIDLPISQFYTVGLDMQEPFFGVYGGLQDNATWGGPSRTRNRIGIVNADWKRMAGGDGFHAAVDPTDHNIAYVESQNGNLLRYDGRTGEQKPIRPQPDPGEPAYRFNWSAPIVISPFDHNTVYFAANHLFKSTNRGDNWQRLGEDLTRAIDRDVLPMMGGIPGDEAVSRHQGTAVFGNISTIDVSTLAPGLLATGSDDGVVGISRDDGQTWNKVTRFPGVPDTTYVSRVVWSKHDEGTIYASFDGHRSNDFKPYVLKSTNYGESWQSISSNLPEFGNVRAVHEHHRSPNLLFVGTEIAPFVSIDGGASWVRLTNGMPPSPVHSIKVHPRDNALVIATHGRGFFVMDDLAPLEHLASAKAAQVAHLFPVQSPLLFVPDGSPSPGTHADRNYSSANPDVGTQVTFLLNEPAPPDGTELEILDGSGTVIRTLEAPTRPGLHRVLWDLRVESPYSGPAEEPSGPPGGGLGGGGFFGGGGANQGPLTLPGQYTARLSVAARGEGDGTVLEQTFTVRKDPMVMLADTDLRRLFDMRMRVAKSNAALTMAVRSGEELQSQIADAKEAAESANAPQSIIAEATRLEEEITNVLCKMRGAPRRGGGGFGGGGFGGGGNRGCGDDAEGTDTRSIQQRIQVANGINRATALPTEYEQKAFANVPAAIEKEVSRLNAVLSQIPAFFTSLDAANVPWTPGRPIKLETR